MKPRRATNQSDARVGDTVHVECEGVVTGVRPRYGYGTNWTEVDVFVNEKIGTVKVPTDIAYRVAGEHKVTP